MSMPHIVSMPHIATDSLGSTSSDPHAKREIATAVIFTPCMPQQRPTRNEHHVNFRGRNVPVYHRTPSMPHSHCSPGANNNTTNAPSNPTLYKPQYHSCIMAHIPSPIRQYPISKPHIKAPYQSPISKPHIKAPNTPTHPRIHAGQYTQTHALHMPKPHTHTHINPRLHPCIHAPAHLHGARLGVWRGDST
eukprot:3099178-Rhodomonas_salina.1